MHNRKRILIPIIILAVIGLLAAAALIGANRRAANGLPQASGTVEAEQVAVSSELSGRVVEVLAQEGQRVQAGDLLLRLDGALLQSQRQRAEAGLAAAEENLAVARVGLTSTEVALRTAEISLETAEANAQAERVVVQQALDALYENTGLAQAEAIRAVAAANRALRDAEFLWNNYTILASQKDLTAMQAISVTWKTLEKARADFEPVRNENSTDPRRKELKEKLDEAQREYDAAVRRMELETAYLKARQALDKAIRDLESLKDGPDPDEAARLQARLAAINAAPRQAQAAVDQARVGVEQAQTRLKQSQAALAQAQAELQLINVQIEKLNVYAPVDGVILTRSVEPGEVVQAGASLLRIGQLDRLKITVYLPEDRYGQVRLGQTAGVAVDSFPGQTFSAQVTYIADQAEFTPRNVQTAEGRKTTVFAIELTIENPQGSLKPGMPADVSFRTE